MTYLSEELKAQGFREYKRGSSVVFLKTHEKFGGLSNMAAGYPLVVNDVPIRTAEALYQACRFPDRPDIQTEIVQQASPMAAKMVGKPHRSQTRPDWDHVRTKIMRWCLRVKLLQNWERFSQLLLSTNDSPIVEQSRKDDFWGAKAVDDETLVGRNVLGRLLMELRKELREQCEPWQELPAPEIPNFRLFGRVVSSIFPPPEQSEHLVAESPPYESTPVQANLWGHADSAEPPRKLSQIEPYPAYKDSGVAWLGDIPAHWELVPLKRTSDRFYSGGTPESSDSRNYTEDGTGLPWVVIADLTRQRRLTSTAKRITERGRASKNLELLPPGTLLYSMYASLGTCSLLEVPAAINQAIIGIVPNRKQLDVEFLHYLLGVISPNIAAEANSSTQANLNAGIVRSIPTLLPPLDEQAAIVKYLAHVDRKIDRFIRSKRRMIELLNEQKQAIIHQAVTKGLDPSVPMKDSGVEGLGEIPAHWEVADTGKVADLISGFPFKSAGFTESLNDIRLLRGINVAVGTIRWDSVVRWPNEQRAAYGMYNLRINDIVLGMDRPLIGGGIRVAKVTSQDVPSLLLQRVCRLRAGKRLNQDFLLAQLSDTRFADHLAQKYTGISVPHVSPGQIKSFPLLVPPLYEQEQIMERLQTLFSSIESSLTAIVRELELIREYRARLVSDVVTGKLDVRKLNLPAETECGSVEIEGALDDEQVNWHIQVEEE